MSKFNSPNFDAYAAALRKRESSGNYAVVNERGYTGAYQFGKLALIDAGFMDRSGNWTSYARLYGVNSWDDFKASPAAQDVAFQNLTEQNWKYLKNHFQYVGQTIGGIPVTVSGMLAGAHLVGHGKLKKFLDSGGTEVPIDGNGVPVTEYMRKFAGYDFIFGNRKGFGGAHDGRLGDPPPRDLWQGGDVPSRAGVPYLNETQAAGQVFGARSWLQNGNAPNVLLPNAANAFAASGGRSAAPVPYLDQSIAPQRPLYNSDLVRDRPSSATGAPDTQNANDVVRQDFSAVQNFSQYRPSYLPPSNAAGPAARFPPVASLPDGLPMTPGVTRGAGYVGSAVAPPVRFVPAAEQAAPGGLLGLIIEAGLNDPLNPDAPPPGGLVGLIQEYMRNNSRGRT